MKKETIEKIKNTPIIYNYLRDNSNHYRNLYRDDAYLKEIETLAKIFYKERTIDKIEQLKNNIDLINTFLSVMK